MPDPFNIRPEQPGDEVAIQRLVSRAFPSDAEARLIDNLRCSRRLVLSLVAVDGDAVDGDEIVGHVSFSPVSLNGREIGWGMAPVSTLPERQRQGIASKLIEAGLDRACRGGVGCAVVLGSPAFYSRFGFRQARQWNLSDEFHGGDAFQALEFIPGTIPPEGGLITYSPEFDAFE